MATIIQPSDLKVTVTETLTLNGTNYNHTTEYDVPSATNYVSNIFQVETGTQRVLIFSRAATPPVNSEYEIDRVKYLRITNSDDTTSIKLTLTYQTSGAQTIRVAPRGSFIITDFDYGGGDSLSNIDITTTADVLVPYTIALA